MFSFQIDFFSSARVHNGLLFVANTLKVEQIQDLNINNYFGEGFGWDPYLNIFRRVLKSRMDFSQDLKERNLFSF